MGNYRFRLSDMMPNAWFYKLKDMGRTRNQNNCKQPIKKKHNSSSSTTTTTTTLTQHSQPNQSHISQHRHSYYYSSEPFRQDRLLYDSHIHAKPSDLDFTDPPRRSSRRRSKRRPINASPKLVTSSVSSGCRCRATLDSVSTTEHSVSVSPPPQSSPDEFDEPIFPEFESDLKHPFGAIDSWTDSRGCRVSSSTTDIIIDMGTKKGAFSGKLDMFDSIPEVELPPILTKPAKFNDMIAEIKNRDVVEPSRIRRNSLKKFVDKDVQGHRLSVKTEREQRSNGHSHRRSSVVSPGVKIRANSPRIACKKIQAYNNNNNRNSKLRRKNVTDSFAVVKSSFDPQRDFRESMVEMILENNIRASKDLEELLACYLSLNSNEYHDLIVKVFEQIWFDLTDIHL